MDAVPSHPAERSAPWSGFFWALLFLGLLAWQAYLTLGLFGAGLSLDGLLDERPVVSGFHPQHQYFGHLGSLSLTEQGRLCVYDPAFQAGYPKTPIFNNSRLAELFLFAGGGGYRPEAYKIGLAVICMLVPVFLLGASLAAGLGGAGSILASLLGTFLWWGPHGRAALEAGDLDVPLAALALLTHMGLLIRFHRAPGVCVWLGLALTAALGWFLQPMLLPIALPLLLIYYLSVGIRHATATWHVALASAQVIGLGVNLFWLVDWFIFWWVRTPLPLGVEMLRHRTIQTIWDAPLWAGALERALAALVLLSCVGGAIILNQTGRRAAARVFGLGSVLLVVLAVLGIAWEPLSHLGTSVLILPGLWFACPLAAHSWCWGVRQLRQAGPVGHVLLTSLAGGVVLLGLLDPGTSIALGQRAQASEPLRLGIGAEREALLEQIQTYTTPEARILWEDRQQPRHQSRWAALLPLWTGRSFLGGLDSEGMIEHSSIGLRDGQLAGRPLSAWTPESLEDYCRRYNIGWIVSWSPRSLEALEQWEAAEKVVPLADDGQGWLFMVKNAPRTFALKGKATLHQADSQHITLSDVEPEDGVVVLSLHYQTGMRATPSRVQVERETCAHDPIGFVRLRVAGPVARMTLSWEGR